MGGDSSKLRLSNNSQENVPSIKLPSSTSYDDNMFISKSYEDKPSVERSRANSTHSRTRQHHPLPLKMRRLIVSCFSNPHEMVGRRIMKRACDLKLEFAGFYSTLLLEQRDELDDNIKYLLKNVVSNIDFVDEVQRLCEDFGQRFVKLRTEGFRPDYFAILADATIKECTHLDSAMHKAHMTTQAFSQFGGMVFSSVRDGFYNEVRRLRRASNSFCTVSSGSSRRKKVSIESVDVPSVIGGSRSGSPGPSFSRSGSFRSVSPESYISDECFMPGDCENDGLLKPPNQNLLVTRSY